MTALSRAVSLDEDVDIIVLLRRSPRPPQDALEVLVRGAAIENLSTYRRRTGGYHVKARDARNSMVVDPWGAYWIVCPAPAW